MMINIKRETIICLVICCFFSFQNINAQKINQLDVNNKRTGVWKKYYSNERIRYEGQFKNGKEVGVFKFYSVTTSDFPTAIKKFEENSDIAHVQFFNLDGKLRTKGTLKGKERIGKWIYFYPNGKLFSEENYSNGKLEGKLINYYPNQKITEETHYKAGLKNGLSQKFTDSGVLIESVNYRDGKPNGEAKFFDVKGNLTEKGTYKDGIKVGDWEFYSDGEAVSKKKKRKSHSIEKQ